MGIADIATTFFINATNHPSSKWSDVQLNAAKEYGTVVDVPFPNVPANALPEEVNIIVDDFIDAILDAANVNRISDNLSNTLVVHIAGEPIVVHATVNTLMRDYGIRCVASTTERVAVETQNADGTVTKTVQFKFVQFRSYLYY